MKPPRTLICGYCGAQNAPERTCTCGHAQRVTEARRAEIAARLSAQRLGVATLDPKGRETRR
ncbi:hypothetical protein [Deinococcus wulumuqiensis]|uniref:hypothetical protein n=1 Tax=Deinococcus wulumuqiensis TaxID=980427 RepID=UPI00242C5E25|nr:hypothetical protein [Deinococcus wulumuqiensis]